MTGCKHGVRLTTLRYQKSSFELAIEVYERLARLHFETLDQAVTSAEPKAVRARNEKRKTKKPWSIS